MTTRFLLRPFRPVRPVKALAALALASATFATLAQALPTVEAEVRKVDKANGKISLKHGEIKNLDMPPMSMVFRVKDKALLDKVQAGDKISFTAAQVDGDYTVMSIEPTQETKPAN